MHGSLPYKVAPNPLHGGAAACGSNTGRVAVCRSGCSGPEAAGLRQPQVAAKPRVQSPQSSTSARHQRQAGRQARQAGQAGRQRAPASAGAHLDSSLVRRQLVLQAQLRVPHAQRVVVAAARELRPAQGPLEAADLAGQQYNSAAVRQQYRGTAA